MVGAKTSRKTTVLEHNKSHLSLITQFHSLSVYESVRYRQRCDIQAYSGVVYEPSLEIAITSVNLDIILCMTECD